MVIKVKGLLLSKSPDFPPSWLWLSLSESFTTVVSSKETFFTAACCALSRLFGFS